MTTIAIPRVQGALADRAGLVTQEWYSFFLALRDNADGNAELQTQIDAVVAQVAQLMDGSGGSASFQMQGIGSVLVYGTPAGGAVQVTLDGDEDAPGSTYYYGTGPDGLRGWYSLASGFAVTADLTKAVDGATGVTTYGLADLPNSGAGAAIYKTTRDAKGRTSGQVAANTDDLPESGTPTNQWFTAARVRATPLTGLATPAASPIAAADSMLAAMGKLQSQISALPGKNLLINPEGKINQVAFAGGALAAGVYGYDGWKAGTGGCNVSINSAGLITHTSGPLVQVVESPGLASTFVTLSVEAPSGTITVAVAGVTGSITAGAGRRGVTIAVPASSIGDITVQLTATGATYSRPQLERGTAATAFEYRPMALELLLCQRTYEKSYGIATAPGTVTGIGRIVWGYPAITGQANRVAFRYGVPKRSVPAVTIYASANGSAGNVTQNDGSSAAVSSSIPSEGCFEITWTNAAGLWGGFFHYVADARP